MSKAAKKPKGRPTTFTTAIADEIVDRLSKGEPLAQICRDDHMPAVRTVSDWKRANEAFSADFAHARDEGYDAIAQRARMTLRGKTEGDGGESTGDIQRDKAIADYDLKLLAKWDPRRYGDKIALTGGDPASGDKPIQTQGEITVRIVRPGDVEPA